MKKIALVLLVFSFCIAIGSCTNDENYDKIDILTPPDSTKTMEIGLAADFYGSKERAVSLKAVEIFPSMLEF